MHSHDRTLIARLGFADPDKQNPMHDQACQYVGTEETSGKLAHAILADQMKPFDFIDKVDSQYTGFGEQFNEIDFRGHRTAQLSDIKWEFESALTKGDGPYKQHIAFIDVVVSGTITETRFGEVKTPSWETYYVDTEDNEMETDVAKSIIQERINIAAREWRVEHFQAVKEFIDQKYYDGGLALEFRGESGYLHLGRFDTTEEKNKKANEFMISQINKAVNAMPDTPKSKNRVREDWVEKKVSRKEKFAIVVEVKVSPVGTGDILRQVNLYREHFNPEVRNRNGISREFDHVFWVVVADFAFAPADQDMLRQSGVMPIRLSSSFDDWVAKQKELACRQVDPAELMTI